MLATHRVRITIEYKECLLTLGLHMQSLRASTGGGAGSTPVSGPRRAPPPTALQPVGHDVTKHQSKRQYN